MPRIGSLTLGSFIRSPRGRKFTDSKGMAIEVLQLASNEGSSILCYPVTKVESTKVSTDTTRYYYIPIDTQVDPVTLGNPTWQLAIPSPSDLSVNSTPDQEIWDMVEFISDLYIGYYTASGTQSAKIYKWNGALLTHFYTFGWGTKYQFVSLEVFNNCLYAGISGAAAGDADIYKFDPNAVATPYLYFNGEASTVTVPNDSSRNAIFGATAFSIEWLGTIDTQGESSQGHIVGKNNGTTTTIGYVLRISSSGNFIVFGIGESGSQKVVTTSTTFTPGTQVHIVVTWTTGTAAKIYINGVEASYSTSTVVTTPTNDTAQNMSIGNRNGATDRTFDGSMNHLRIFRGVNLSASDVTTLYNGGNISGATAEYLFSEGTGLTTVDTVAGNNGTLSASTNWRNTAWTKVYDDVADHNGVFVLKKFNGKIYAGFAFGTSDADIYESSDGSNWALSYASTGATLVECMEEMNGSFYSGLGGNSDGDAEIIKFDGVSSWSTVYDGTGTLYRQCVSLKFYKNKYYAGMLKNSANAGSDILVSNDGVNWSVAYSYPVGNRIHALGIYNNRLYAGLGNATGQNIILVFDGVSWVVSFPGNTEREVFRFLEYSGVFYAGMGFKNGQANIYRYKEPQ